MQGHVLLSSRLAVVEVTKAVARVSPATDATPALAHISFVELDPELALVASRTGDPTSGALDAIHVASALRVAHDIEAFVTYDSRQAAVAETAGLHVGSPGQRPSAVGPP